MDDDEPMTWVKDGVMDCEELWAMPGYGGIPRVHPQHPIVSLDNADVVCLKVARDRDNADVVCITFRKLFL